MLAAELRRRGHDAVAPDLPCYDDSAGLAEYTEAVIDAIGDRTDLVVVAQSLGGFTAPLVCERVPAELLVLLTAMVPTPGEPPGEWWANTGWEQARREQDQRDGRTPDDDTALFLHDVPPELAAEAARRGRAQSGTPFVKPPMRSMAATASPSATPTSWPTGWRATEQPHDRTTILVASSGPRPPTRSSAKAPSALGASAAPTPAIWPLERCLLRPEPPISASCPCRTRRRCAGPGGWATRGGGNPVDPELLRRLGSLRLEG